jgi:3-hydroxyacyl-CoA dehydrogenase / enoyl-CoA hydratase / 3-hydroxybutyryl-CoA epimerase
VTAPPGEQSPIGWERGEDGIVVLTLRVPQRGADAAYAAAIALIVGRLEAERDTLSGVAIASAGPQFLGDSDPSAVLEYRREDSTTLAAALRGVGASLRRLETLGLPVVALIGGDATGDGLALALAAHHRIAVDDPAITLAMPQVQLGLMPAHGGLVRSVRILGVASALTQVLLQGTRHTPQSAIDLGLIDALVTVPEDLLAAAKAWIAANPDPIQPWDRNDYRMPGGTPSTPQLAAFLPAFPANLRKQLKGANYPAPRNIMCAAVEGAQLDFDGAMTVETRYLVELLTGQVAKNMVQAFHFDVPRAAARAAAGAGDTPVPIHRLAILGAGMMGSAIAYVAAAAGIEVTLKDVSLEAAERGKGHATGLGAAAVVRGRLTQEDANAVLARIKPTADIAAVADAELVIEAVFEDAEVKAQALGELQSQLAAGALVASNTSTLPITGLAGHVARPDDFIGLHFFSPVEKMPLLEIIKGRETSPSTLARALDFAHQLGKTPIVVNDSRGFFTSRVIMTFINEAMAMVLEGVPAPSIEQAASQAGYPTPALALADELNLKLLRKIRGQYKAAASGEGRAWRAHPSEALIDAMLDAHQRPGRLEGAGFYDYAGGKRLGLWPGLAAVGSAAGVAPPLRDVQERLLFIEAIEAVRCLDESVIESVGDANVGSVLGIGYPAWTGGVLQYINGYHGGPGGFVARCGELAGLYGDRFSAPASLVDLAAREGRFGDA